MVKDQCDFNLNAVADGLSDENYIYVRMVLFSDICDVHLTKVLLHILIRAVSLYRLETQRKYIFYIIHCINAIILDPME